MECGKYLKYEWEAVMKGKLRKGIALLGITALTAAAWQGVGQEKRLITSRRQVHLLP